MHNQAQPDVLCSFARLRRHKRGSRQRHLKELATILRKHGENLRGAYIPLTRKSFASLVQPFVITVTYSSSDSCLLVDFFEQDLQVFASKGPLEWFCDPLVMALETEEALLRFG